MSNAKLPNATMPFYPTRMDSLLDDFQEAGYLGLTEKIYENAREDKETCIRLKGIIPADEEDQRICTNLVIPFMDHH